MWHSRSRAVCWDAQPGRLWASPHSAVAGRFPLSQRGGLCAARDAFPLHFSRRRAPQAVSRLLFPCCPTGRCQPSWHDSSVSARVPTGCMNVWCLGHCEILCLAPGPLPGGEWAQGSCGQWAVLLSHRAPDSAHVSSAASAPCFWENRNISWGRVRLCPAHVSLWVVSSGLQRRSPLSTGDCSPP